MRHLPPPVMMPHIPGGRLGSSPTKKKVPSAHAGQSDELKHVDVLHDQPAMRQSIGGREQIVRGG
jgi:hypothetical protein